MDARVKPRPQLAADSAGPAAEGIRFPVGPDAPMGGVDQNPFPVFRIDPPTIRPAARENEHMNFASLDHAQLQIAIEWRV